MNIGTEAQERRAGSRFELLEYALISNASHESSRSVVVDVSLGGLQTRGRRQFVSSETMLLQVGRLSDQPLLVHAEVCYSTPVPDSDLYSTGFRITPSSPQQRMDWADFVHEIFQNGRDRLY